MKKLLVTIVLVVVSVSNIRAQYYEMANQLVDMISPALSGSFKYRGMVDAGYMKGLGDKNADVLEISTTQGFKYASWFYMGIGAGVNIMFSNIDNGIDTGWKSYYGNNTTETGVMIPLYSDFRFNIGSPGKTSFFIDLRIGAAFMIGDYLRLNGGYLTQKENFYFKPSLGLRIPINKNNQKQAINVSASYNLIDSDCYMYGYYDNAILQSLGVTVGFEW